MKRLRSWDFYDAVAEGYVALHGAEQKEKLALIRKHFFPRGCLLDVGAGPGFARDFFPGCAVVALEPAQQLIRHYDGFFAVSPAESMPFASRVFDAVLSVSALHHVSLERGWGEIRRVAKPGACCAFSLFKRARIASWQNVFEKVGFVRKDIGLDWLFVGTLR